MALDKPTDGEKETHKSSLSTKLVCGAVAGIIGTSMIFPLDLIKTRLQNQTIVPNGPQYKGIIDCGSKMIASGGVRSLYQGIIPNLIGISPEKAIKLAVNDYSREFWASRVKSHPDHLPVVYGVLSGATAGFCQVIVTNPMEIVKIQMQLAGSASSPPKHHPTTNSNATHPTSLKTMDVVKSLGLKGLYRGTLATLARDVPFSFVFFPAVSVMKATLTPANQQTPFSAVFASGVVSGAIAAAVVTPMDVIKTKLQVIPKSGDRAYTGMLDCYQHVLKTDGVKGLFRGVVPRVLIVSPLFAITVLVYEFQQRFWAKSH